MPAHLQAAGKLPGDAAQIAGGVPLGGHFFHEAHIEVFPPAQQGVVGAAKGRVGKAGHDPKGNRRKLLGPFAVGAAGKAPTPARFESGRTVRLFGSSATAE